MDTSRFDRWTCTLATAQSRRGAVGLLFASALAATTGHVGARGNGKGNGGGGKGKGNGGNKPKGCKKNQRKCGNRCIPKGGCCSANGDECPLFCIGEVCQPDGSCACNPGTIQMNGVCGFPPKCLNAGNFNGNGPQDCCSGRAIFDTDEHTGESAWICLPGERYCLTDIDCLSGGLGRCKGYLCPELRNQINGGRCPHLG